MTLNLTVTSPDIDDFSLELLIDANNTFLDLHRLIMAACLYTEGEKHRFYICDEDWHPEQRILLNDEGITNADEDLYLMKDTVLGDFLENEGQRLAYRYDPEGKRLFLIELTETSFGSRLNEPKVVSLTGYPPIQTEEDETEVAAAKPQVTNMETEIEETFYGDESFDADEFDPEGFDILEG